MGYCIRCMRPIVNGAYCTYCESKGNTNREDPYALPCGEMLQDGKYLIGRVMGKGGFGITYLGMQMNIGQKVAIKEYCPRHNVVRDANASTLTWNTTERERRDNCNAFVSEARAMAKAGSIPNVVRVNDIVEENNTAYIVMQFIEGRTLKEEVERSGAMTAIDCVCLLRPVIHALGEIHRKGMLHRDVSPDNIMIDTRGDVWLLDLGAAKGTGSTVAEENSGFAAQLLVKPGYSPPEQYEPNGNVGPWTDVYSMCATIYFCLTGKHPPDVRKRETGQALFLPSGIEKPFVRALFAGLRMKTDERIYGMDDLEKEFDNALGEAVKSELVAGKKTAYTLPNQDSASSSSTFTMTVEPIETAVLWSDQKRKADTTPKYEPVFTVNNPEVPISTKQEIQQNRQKTVRKKPWKTIALTLAAILVLSAIVCIVSSFRISSHNMLREDNPFNEINIEGWESLWDVVTIMGKVNDYPVFGSKYKRSEIDSIHFVGTLKDAPEDKWNVSSNGNAVFAWVQKIDTGLYALYIGAEGGVVAPKNCAGLFAGYNNVKNIEFGNTFRVNPANNLQGMFYNCCSLSELDVSRISTGRAEDMSWMFFACSELQNINVSKLHTWNAKNMRAMFAFCTNIQTLDLKKWKTGKVVDMSLMFSCCYSLENVNVSNFDTRNVTNMDAMFESCNSLEELDISSFDYSSVQSADDFVNRFTTNIIGDLPS